MTPLYNTQWRAHGYNFSRLFFCMPNVETWPLIFDPREYQRDTQHHNRFQSAEPGILCSAFFGSAEGVGRHEG